jgi:7-cyano-7-deazaguanine synthase
MKVIAVLSGGMDSSVAMAWALSEGIEIVGALSFEYGAKHNEKEWAAAQQIATHYKIPITRISLPFINEHFQSDLLLSGGEIPEGHYEDESMKKTVVPFRNGIMLSIAAGFAESKGASGVVLGNHFGDHAIYPDCRKSFIEPMAQAISEGTFEKISLLSPFCSMTKTDIARLGAKLAVPLHLTWSCYKGGEKHCGKCGTCVERILAFRESGVPDPTEYEHE